MMKSAFFILLGTAALLSQAAAEPRQTSRSFYDRSGSFAGSSQTRGNTTSFTDRSGHFSGSAIRNSDGTISFYNRNGHFTGSIGRGR